MNDPVKVCRVCMRSAGLVDIFAERPLAESEPSLAEMLNECVEFKVKPEDKISTQICKCCISDVKIAFRLKRNAEQSRKLLTTRLEDELKEFIDTLEAEDWELIGNKVNIKEELNETVEQQPSAKPQEKLKPNRRKASSRKAARKLHKCKWCGKQFEKRSSLEKHNRVHTGERPYKCPKCLKDFSQTSSVNIHMRLHTGERTFKCPYCPQDFTRKHHLQRHVGNKHHGMEAQSKLNNKHKIINTNRNGNKSKKSK